MGVFATSFVGFGSGALVEAETKKYHLPMFVLFVFLAPSSVPGIW